jgi:outer membrane receptor protein involved in Fe transport
MEARWRSLMSLTVALLLSSAYAVTAQPAPAGHVTGVVSDALGRPLADTLLHLQSPEGREVARTTSDQQGRFTLPDVAPGTYAVTADKADFQTGTAIVTVTQAGAADMAIVLTATKPLDLALAAKQLDAARIAIEPRIGASTYTITQRAIENQPGGGENLPFNQVLLQTPGTSQDSFGQIHVRNEHANLQYRINGVILPEGISVFGQSLSPRFANQAELITGALPAQYGLRTAGIIDIQTKSGAFEQGGYVGMYGGSHDWLQPSAEYSGSVGRFNYYVTGDYLQNSIGIESPTSGSPIHDNSQQGHGFAYLSGIIDPTSRVSAIFGTFRGQFQIPNIPGQTPSNTVNGSADFDSAKLNENQREISHYGILSYLKTAEDSDFQLSTFTRYSSVTFRPDPFGDLAFNGISQDAYRRSIASGIQGDGSYKIVRDHTLRSGFVVTGERSAAQTNSLVEPAGGPDTPFNIADSSGKTGWTYSIYLQDEWRLTPQLTINYGGRFDVVNAFTNENQISPRINAVYKPAETTTLHAGYARYFTPPPFELVATTSVNNFVGTTGAPPGGTLNAPVRAERADYFDIGVSQQLAPGLKAGIDTYYKHSHNLIDEGQFGAPIILTPFNYRVARNYGVELTTSYDVDKFSFYGNLAIAQQKAKDIVSSQFNFDPGDLAFIATNAIHTDHDQLMTASAGASYLWQDTRFSVNLIAGSGLRAGGDHPNGHALPSYEQVNLGVSQNFAAPTVGAFEARFDIINVFDEVYKIRDGTGVGVGAPQFGPRRAFFAGLKKQF